MFKKMIGFIFLVPLAALAQPTGEELLKAMDDLRVGSDQVRVLTEVTLIKNQKKDATKLYEVLVSTDARTLAIFRTKKEKGQKVLMLGDDFWLLMPKSKRPIRITPMQKLLGEASTGDIASLRWSEDYQVQSMKKLDTESGSFWELELAGKRKALSYQKVLLRLSIDTYWPVSADLYLSSGKLAKTASYQVEVVEGQPRMQSMTLIDGIQTNQQTLVKYLETEPTNIPDKFFNPTYLQRNPEL